MSRFHRWLARRQRVSSQRRNLSDALIGDGAAGYAGYRLKYLSVRMVLRVALHVAEMFLFARYFEEDFLAGVILIRTAIFLATSLWWGGLEQLREEVRDQTAAHMPHLARRAIEKWLALSVAFSSLASVAGIGIILATPNRELGLSIYNAYAIACFIRLFLDLVSRTYHSGMYAISRVYRPLWSVLIGDVLDVALVLAMWPWLGVWCFSISFLLVGILRFVILVHFTGRAYRKSKLLPVRLHRILAGLTHLKGRELNGFFQYALANGAAQIDSILVMALTAFSRDTATLALAILLYMLRPMISAGYSWSRLFYFDMKLLWRSGSDFLRARFEGFLKRVALWFSAAVGILCLALGQLLGGEALVFASLLFVPFLMVRSYLGLYQLMGFTYRQFKYLAGITVLALLGIVGFIGVQGNPALMMASITGWLGMVIWRLPPRFKSPAHSRIHRDSADGPAAWLHSVLRQTPGAAMFAVTLDRRILPVSRVMRHLRQRYPSIEMTRISRSRFCLFTPHPLLGQELVQACGGAAVDVEALDVSIDGKNGPDAIIRVLLDVHIHNSGQKKMAAATSDRTPAAILGIFNDMFPTGQVLTPKSGRIPAGRLKREEVRRLARMLLAERTHDWCRPVRMGKYNVFAFAPAGKVALLLLLRADEDAVRMAAFRQMLAESTLRASVQLPH
jgi:hypothetical protein